MLSKAPIDKAVSLNMLLGEDPNSFGCSGSDTKLCTRHPAYGDFERGSWQTSKYRKDKLVQERPSMYRKDK